jgi:hypothetical protein
MPRVCTICAHPERTTIDRMLVGGRPLRETSALYRVSEDALGRHRDTHLAPVLAIEQIAVDAAEAGDLLSQVQGIQKRTLAILKKAEDGDKLALALAAIREARGNLELLARLEGKIRDQQTVNILIAPQWLDLRAVIVRTLDPYPEARQALASVLAEVADDR